MAPAQRIISFLVTMLAVFSFSEVVHSSDIETTDVVSSCYNCYYHQTNQAAEEFIMDGIRSAGESNLKSSRHCQSASNTTGLTRDCQMSPYCVKVVTYQDKNNWLIRRFCGLHCEEGPDKNSPLTDVYCCKDQNCNGANGLEMATPLLAYPPLLTTFLLLPFL
ncbi:uncharacterized protein LOC141912287 [Tubulanus polymorphus]|uniref:uncharacterized protein LOC141912287 n=1 Tax=Tubulanus polymorphus TaxID=672921 RepID=UPI003DA6C86B